MNAQQKTTPTPEQIDALAAWAEAGDFSDITISGALSGDQALAAGRALMEAAGVDVDAVGRSRVGRPSLSTNAAPGTTAPMWHVRAPADLNSAARALAKAQGRDLSALVREAVDTYVHQAV
jgi:hypothetical protein